MSLRFNDVPVINEVSPVFNAQSEYNNDTSPMKVDLIVGIYRSDDGNLYFLPVVKKAEQMVLKETLNHDYLPSTGIHDFTKMACTLLLGDIERQWNDEMIFGVQTLGGTGALRMGADFLVQFMKCTTVYHSDITWENHRPTFLSSGFQNIRTYRYVNVETKTLDIEGLYEDLSNALENSVILLHACGHNPTCVDPTKEQWKRIAKIIKERNLIPFFDIAYQGLASGDLEEDTWAIRYFQQEGLQFLCAHSFSKIFTLYNERVGNLMFVLKSSDNVKSVKMNVTKMITNMYLNPPNHGVQTVFKILTDSELYNEWVSSFTAMANRVKDIRLSLRKALEEIGAPGTWNHVTDQRGMFVFLNLTDAQVQYLRTAHHVYMLPPGRINVTGLNQTNIKYVAQAIADTLNKNVYNSEE